MRGMVLQVCWILCLHRVVFCACWVVLYMGCGM